ncbi:MAG TPA: hypothetical protein VGV89_09185, partial [Thermoplasmata archaeon]|nr:hypothetical protein [Thermoplasmata archaeon]
MPPAIRARVTVFLGIVIAVLVLLATEAAATSAPAAAPTVTPPFVGVLKSTSTGATTSGCGTTTPISKLNWSARTGHISWGGRAAAPRCSTVTVPESAVRDASLTLYIPFRVATGNHTILANFTVSALLGNSFRGGTC